MYIIQEKQMKMSQLIPHGTQKHLYSHGQSNNSKHGMFTAEWRLTHYIFLAFITYRPLKEF